MAVTRGFEFGNAHEFRAGPVVKILGQGDIGDLAFGGATFTIHHDANAEIGLNASLLRLARIVFLDAQGDLGKVLRFGSG